MNRSLIRFMKINPVIKILFFHWRNVKTEKVNSVREIQHEILQVYEKDFAKHALPHEIMKITTVWQQVHRQLGKENKKFIFAAIKQSARVRDYEGAIQWLADAGLIHKSYSVK